MIRGPTHTNLMEMVLKLGVSGGGNGSNRIISGGVARHHTSAGGRKRLITSVYQCQTLSSKSNHLFNSIVSKCLNKVHFSMCEIKILLLLFQELNNGDVGSSLKEDDFRNFLMSQFDIRSLMALQAIVRAFKSSPRSKGFSAEEFVCGMSVYLRGSLEERIHFAFKGFDYDGDQLLRRREEFARYLQNSFDPKSEACLDEIDPDQPIRDTANYLVSKFTHKSEVVISDMHIGSTSTDVNLAQFKRQCLKNPPLGVFGTDFPERKQINSFPTASVSQSLRSYVFEFETFVV